MSSTHSPAYPFLTEPQKPQEEFFFSFYSANWWFNFSMEYIHIREVAKGKGLLVCALGQFFSSSSDFSNELLLHTAAVQGTYLQFEVKILVLCFPSNFFPLLHSAAHKTKIVWNTLTVCSRAKQYFLLQVSDAVVSFKF